MFFGSFGLLAMTGCKPEATIEPPAKVETETAQTRFDRIVEKVREDLEGTDDRSGGRFTLRDSLGAGSGAYAFTVQPSTKIIPEPARGEVATASITVTLETSYAARSNEQDDDDVEEDRKEKRKRNQPATGGFELSDQTEGEMEVFDSELLSDPATGPPAEKFKGPDLSTSTKTAKVITRYDLVYERDRWSLASPPQADAPDSANDAIERAIKRQG